MLGKVVEFGFTTNIVKPNSTTFASILLPVIKLKMGALEQGMYSTTFTNSLKSLQCV